MVCYTEVSTIQRLFYMHSNLPGPTKAVCYREVSTIRGVCYERFHCICKYVYHRRPKRRIWQMGLRSWWFNCLGTFVKCCGENTQLHTLQQTANASECSFKEQQVQVKVKLCTCRKLSTKYTLQASKSKACTYVPCPNRSPGLY